MLECPSCGRKNQTGVLFCIECGVYLPVNHSLRTDPLPEDETPAPRANPWAAAAYEPGRPTAKPTMLRIVTLEGGRSLSLPVKADISIGRLDAAHGIFPDLDLTPEAGLVKGVSRRHARILCQDERIFAEDLGSANGTFVNGERLTPYLPYPLNSGDELCLGSIRMSIEFGYEHR